MSSIKLKHSGGNSVIIAAPASNPASDRTLTLPSNADGTVLTTTNPKAGNIIQVVSVTKTDTTSTSSSTFGKISGLQPTITPSSTSSKILIKADLCIGASSNGADSPLKLFRSVGGSDTDIGIGDAAGNRTRCFWGVEDFFSVSSGAAGYLYVMAPASTNFLDSPNTTSAVTYGVNWRIVSGNTIYLNRTGQDNDASNYPRGSSTITLMEVAG